MIICPNCGQKTSGIDSCEWCKYPLPIGSRTRRRNAQKQAEKEAKLAAQEEARKKADEEKQAKEAQQQAEKQASKTEEETKRKDEEVAGLELYEGMVQLKIVAPVDLGQVRKLQEHLHQVQDLDLVLVGGSVNEGTVIVVSVARPIPLINILREI